MGGKMEAVIGQCALCGQEKELKLSHIIPKFVFRFLKKDSYTGKMRNLSNPNVPLQDGDKKYLLCGECEERFSKNETKFSIQVFFPFKQEEIIEFKYDGNWLAHFITSVNWRTLYLDIPGFENHEDEQNLINEKQILVLKKAEETMRQYLLGNRLTLDSIENHIYFFENVQKASKAFNELRPHSMVHGGIFGYTVLSRTGGIYVFANLLGVIIVTIITKDKHDKWKNTFVKNEAGKIKKPQQASSPVFNEFSYVNSQRVDGFTSLSEKQRQGIVNKIQQNPERFKESASFKRIIKDRNIEILD
jgi:hypothetical protein